MSDFQLALVIFGAIASTIPVVLTNLKTILAKVPLWAGIVPEIQSLLLSLLAFVLGVLGVFVAVDSKLVIFPQTDTPPIYLYLFLGAACAYGGEILRVVVVFLYTRSFPPAPGAQSATNGRRGYLPWL